MSGNISVVSRYEGQAREIFAYRSDVNQYWQLTNNGYSDRYPCFQGNCIAWMSGEDDSADIFAALLNPDSLLNVPYYPNPLITGDPPVIPPYDNGTSHDTPTKPPANQPGSSPENKLIEPASRCFLGSCRAGCW